MAKDYNQENSRRRSRSIFPDPLWDMNPGLSSVDKIMFAKNKLYSMEIFQEHLEKYKEGLLERNLTSVEKIYCYGLGSMTRAEFYGVRILEEQPEDFWSQKIQHSPKEESPEPFNFSNPGDWPKWIRRFERFRQASGLINNPENEQVNMLVYCMGDNADDILLSCKIASDQLENYDKVIECFESHFIPRRNIIYERARFNQRCQQEGEKVNEFITALHSLAEHCNFEMLHDELIRDRIVVGVRDRALSERMQLDTDLTLVKATLMAKQLESVKEQQSSLYQQDSVDQIKKMPNHIKETKRHEPKIRQFKSNQLGGSSHGCTRCGNSNNHDWKNCPAMNSYCNKCMKKGHYAKVCRSEAINEIKSEIAFLGSVEDNSKKWIVPIKVNNRQVNFKIDTGADVNVLPLQYYYQSFQRIKLEKSDKVLQGPNGIPLKTVGMIHVKLQNKGQHLNSKIYIVDKLKQPLLSGETSEKLNIVRMIQQLSSNFLNPKREFPKIFNGLGHAKINYKISLQPDAKPYALCTPRRVPIPLMKQVKEQLEEMTRLGVIESVEEPTEWCAGMVAVSKPGGKIRICVDLTKLNQYIRRENYPLPATEHILGQLGNACYFSKLDANSGFWQFGLAKESQKLTTFITPFGRFFFKRIPFGITSAPEIFQRKMTQLLGNIEGVVCFMDDIVVYGSSLEEHNERVRQVLKKIQEEGMTLNPEKCQFGVKTVKFLGHTLSSEGLFIDEEKLDAITKMEAPRSTKELKSFLGMVNYLGKFIPNLADKLQPLNSLLSTKNEWVWDEPQKKSFNLLKQELVSRPNLALFDPSITTIVSADASSFGIGGVLRQEQPDGSLKPIAYVSRTLSETEKRYSQIEKEGLAIVWTCERLKDYVTGIKIHIETDHKPLIAIFTSKSLEDMTPRLQRLKMRMMRYSYQISHIAGKKQIVADMLSRKPMSKPHKDELEEELSAYIQSIEFPATEERLLEISRKQKEDSLCSQLAKYCMSGWPKNKREVDPELRGYWQFQEDLTYQNGISQEIERMVSSCTKCLKERKPKHEPLMPSEFPIRPWQKVGMDLFYLNGRWYLIVCDYYSRYPEISLLQNLTAQEVIGRLKSIFARHGTPETVRSDNGPQFQKVLGSEFSKFSKEWSFKHITSSPKFPQSNGFIEAIIKNIKQSFKKEEDCYLTLQAYRTMPLESGYSPAELLMGRRLRTSVPAIESSLMPRYLDSEALQEREKRRVINQKRLYDKRHDVHSLPPLQQGDSVWVRDQRVKGKVLHKSEEPRSYWVQTPQGKVRRNRLHLTPLPKMGSTMDASEDDQEQETEEDCPTPTASSTRDGRMQRDNQDQDPEKSLPSMPAVHTRYGRALIRNSNKTLTLRDFLNNFGLVIDIKNKRLIDGITNLSIRGVIQSISDMGNISTLNSSSKVSAILTKYPNLCRPPSDFVEAKHSVKHYIPTRCQPIHSKARRLDSQRLTLAKAEFQYMLNNGIIRPSNSPWASPLHLVSKKDESLRPCGDYRRLNAVTLPDRYPIPRLDDFHHILKGTRVYSKIYLCKAFYQIPIAEEDKPKTAIIIPFGLFEFNVMSFGLRNATATFQRFMHEVLRNLDFAFVYLDDIVVASKAEEEHYSHLETLFSRLNSYGLKINLSKSKFLVQEIDFLGYLITSHGVKPLPTKVKAILEYKKPKTVNELRIFLGMLNFYRTFLNNAAETQAILHEYLRGAKKKDRSKIKWTEEAEVQFEKCKQALVNTALLAYPDTELPISLCTDASDRAVGSVLQKLDNNNWKPIAFFSKKLNPAQCNYSTYDRELLAIYLSIKFFKHLLEAREFTILTDHKPLIYAFKQKNEKASPIQLRHLQYFSQFTTDIKYIKGTDNIVADALSRVDAITTIDYEEIAKEQTGDSELQNLISKNTSLKFKQCPLQSGKLLWCDVTTNNYRPFIPIKFRMMVFRNFHELSHPGIKATTKQLTSRFIWPNMNKDIRKWAQACVNCQKCKVSIHTKSEIGKYQEVDERFSVVHIDLIGPLPSSNGNIYCLTCIDRYTSWMEVVPLPDMKSETVARAFYENWIVRFGAPHTVISDQGKQFTSQLFKDLTTLCGIKLRHSTAYHPQCNGKIERLHRTIKTVIRAHTPQIYLRNTILNSLMLDSSSSASLTSELNLVLISLENNRNAGVFPVDLFGVVRIFQDLNSTLQLVKKLDRYPFRKKRKIDSVEQEEKTMNIKKEATTQVGSFFVQHLPRNPSMFSGEGVEDPRSWLKGYERVAKHNQWDETLCLANVYFYLTGTALKWYENNEESIQTWTEFMSQLENVFGKNESSRLRAEKILKTRAQLKGESTEYYIQDVLRLCKEVDPQMNEEDKISHLMKGIAEELYQALIPRDVHNTEQFVTECRRIESIHCKRVTPTKYERLPNVASLSDHDDRADLSSMIRQIVREEVQRALGSTREEPKISTIEDMVKEEIGRTLAPISKPRRSSPQKERPPRKTQPVASPFPSGKLEDASYFGGKAAKFINPPLSTTLELKENYIDIKIEGKMTRALVDSGASYSVISERFRLKLRKIMFAETDVTLRVANDKIVRPKGRCTLKLDLNGLQESFEFVVMEDCSHEVILGWNFLKLSRAIIDSADDTLFLEKCLFEDTPKNSSPLYSELEYRIEPASIQLIKVASRDIPNDAIVVAECRKELLLERELTAPSSVISLTNNRGKLWVVNWSPYPKLIPQGMHVADSAVIEDSQLCTLADCNQVETEAEHSEDPKISEFLIDDSLDESQKEKLRNLLKNYTDIFEFSKRKQFKDVNVKHRINTGDHLPTKQRPYRVAPRERQIIQDEVNKMEKLDIIQPSESPWASPVVLIRKKDGSWRFCVDYRRLNKITKKDVYPLPRIDDTLDCLRGARFYSSMDLQSGYWQIDVEESDREKTAFITPDGLYEFKVMPFGLCNAPATFERMIDNLLKGLKWTICLCYLDDIIVFSDGFEEHLRRLQLVLNCLKKAGLCLNSKKCKFGAKTITVLGHEVSENGIRPDQEKIRAVRDFATPRSLKEVRSFLGLSSYYRRFIPNYAHVAQPLNDLLKKDSAFNWNQEEQNAFEALKSALISEPALGHFDYSSPTEIHTDASNYGIGAVLVQIQKGKERAIAYASRTLNKAEKNYSTTERECLAIIWAINIFRPYVFGQPFTIVTDHHSLCWLTNLKDPCGRLARWALRLQEFDVTVVYKSGRKHQDADCLSRSPLEYSEDMEEDIPSIVTLQNFSEEQMNDQAIRKIADKLQSSPNNSFVKIDNTLYRKNYDPMGKPWLLVVPRHLRQELLKNFHDSPTAGHLGFTKTYDRIRKKYYWPGMYRTVRRYVAHCSDCQRRKHQPQLPSGHLQPIPVPEVAFEKVGMDLLGRFPTSEGGNRWIIVCTDYLTKYAITKALPTSESMEVAKFFIEDVILKHGAPRELITDRGRNFTSSMISDLNNQCRITHRKTTAYHPQTNGLTERLNKTIADMLSMYVDVNHKDWDRILPFVTFAYNTAKQESTGFTPFFLVHGREAETPLDVLFPKLLPEDDDFIQTLGARAEEARKLARIHSMRSQGSNNSSSSSKITLLVGYSEKLMRRYFGPYKVTRKISDVTYEVETFENQQGRRKTKDLVHIGRMKPYLNPEDQEDQLEEDPEDDSTNFQEEDIPTERTQQPQTREEISGPITRSRALRLR
ncbi:K02A2.6-like, partial [Cordylochernes scorpioides]